MILLKNGGKLVHFSANFLSFNEQIRNTFKNVICIACKWCKIGKYYVYSIVISLSLVKRIKSCIWVKYFIYAVFWRFKICCHLRISPPPNLYSQTLRVHEKEKKGFSFHVCSERDLRANERPPNKWHWMGQHTTYGHPNSMIDLAQRAESVKNYSSSFILLIFLLCCFMAISA